MVPDNTEVVNDDVEAAVVADTASVMAAAAVEAVEVELAEGAVVVEEMPAVVQAPVVENLDEVCTVCEQQELSAENGVPPVIVYSRLLAAYLAQNDLVNAKFLWKRIPDTIKSEAPELEKIWTVGRALWKREFVAVFSAVEAEVWSAEVSPLMEMLVTRLRLRLLEIVSSSYSIISVNALSEFIGLDESAAIQLAMDRDWSIDLKSRHVRPVRHAAATLTAELNSGTVDTDTTASGKTELSSDQLLTHLTDYISFLEN